MSEFVEVNGSKIEKGFFQANLEEAREAGKWTKHKAEEVKFHEHCLICMCAVPEKANENFYVSKSKKLCEYCFNTFMAAG